jgi:uncharacterized membrane protein YqiK
MLVIDRVTTQLEVVPSSDVASASAESAAQIASTGGEREREDLKQTVREVLNDYLRELERQGLV